MHSLQAFALMHEKRIARLGSRCTRIQRSASRTVWPGSNGTSWCSKRPCAPGTPRQILSLACKPQALRGEAQPLVPLPVRLGLAAILALMRATALRSAERSADNAFGHEAHVAQIVEVLPLGIQPRARCAQLGGL